MYYDCYRLTISDISDVAIIAAKGAVYRCIIHGVSKSETIRLFENSVFDDCGYI